MKVSTRDAQKWQAILERAARKLFQQLYFTIKLKSPYGIKSESALRTITKEVIAITKEEFDKAHISVVLDEHSLNAQDQADRITHLDTYIRPETHENASLAEIFDFLELCINNPTELLKDNYQIVAALKFIVFSEILNSPIQLFYYKNSSTNSFHFITFPSPVDTYTSTFLPPNTLRPLAEAAIDYINTLQEAPESLRPLAPVAICLNCHGIFMKKRTDQKYCTKQCKFTAWASEKGNKYFAEKAKRNRLAKKNQNAMKAKKSVSLKDVTPIPKGKKTRS